MKNVKSIGKRFLALLLAAVMVVGLLPVGVVAEDTVTTTPANAASSATSVTEFKAEMVRTETTAAVTDEVTGAVVIPAVYTYEVKVYVGGNDVTSSSTIWWAKGYQEKEFVADTNSWINTAIVENTNEPILAAMVMYNEETMKLLLCNATAADAPTEKDTEVWGAVGTSAWSGQMYVGIPVSCPDFYTVKAASYGFTDTVGMTYAEEYVDYNTSAGLIAKKVTAEQSPVVYSRVFRGKDGVTVYEALDYSAKITWPELNAQFKIDETTYNDGESTNWYSGTKKVTITVRNANLYSADYLPSIEGGANATAWTAVSGADKTWSATVDVSESTTIRVGNESLNVKIDTNKPEITGSAYMIDGDTARVSVSASNVGGSGVAYYTIDGKKFETSASAGSFEIDNPSGKIINVSVTANNGLTSASSSIDIKSELVVNVSTKDVDENVIATKGSTKFLKKDTTNTLHLEIVGASDNENSDVYLNKNTIKIEGATVEGWSYQDGIFVADVEIGEKGLQALKINVTDKAGRTASFPAEGEISYTYQYDTTAPTIKVEREVAANDGKTVNDVEYFQNDVKYTITVKDEVALSNDVTAKYKLEGEEQFRDASGSNGEYTFTVSAGQKLVDIQVAAKDMSGLPATEVTSDSVSFDGLTYKGNPVVVDGEAPVVDVQLSSNILFVKDENNLPFAYIVKTDDAVNGTVTITVSDENLDPSSFNNWTEVDAGKKYKKIFESDDIVVNQTGKISIDGFVAVDYSGRAAEKYTLNGTQSNDGILPTYTVEATDKNGTFSAWTINIDRRYPSGGPENVDNVPAVNFVAMYDVQAKAQINGIPVFGRDLKGFQVTVVDTSDGEGDSGVKAVKWSLDNGELTDVPSENSVYELLLSEDLNGNEITLNLYVEDYVGNSNIYTYKFGRDSIDPTVVLSYDTNDFKTGNSYKTRAVHVEFKDTNLSENVVTVYVNGEATTYTFGADVPAVDLYFGQAGVNTANALYFADNATYRVEAACKDAVGNEASDISHVLKGTDEAAVNVDGFVINNKHPEVEIVKNTTDVATVEGEAEYYQNPVSYTITIRDDNMDINSEAANAAAKVTIDVTYEDGSAQITKPEDIKTDSNGITSYTYIVEVKAGQVLTGIQISASDNTGNTAALVSGEDFADTADGNVSYNGKKIAVNAADTNTPTYTITRTGGNYVQTRNDVDYFNGEVTYTIVVNGKYLSSNKEKVSIEINGSNAVDNVDYEIAIGEGEVSNDDTLTIAYTVTADPELKAMKIKVVDAFGNVATLGGVTDDANAVDGAQIPDFTDDFAMDGGVLTYTGNIIDVDQSKLKLTAVLDAGTYKIEKFYKNGDQYYVCIADQSDLFDIIEDLFSPDKSKNEEGEVTFTLTFTISGAENLDVETMNDYLGESAAWTEDDNGNWLCSIPVTVAKNNTAQLAFNIAVIDLAGHTPSENLIINGEDFEDAKYPSTMLVERAENEKRWAIYNSSIGLDLRTPGTGSDENGAPVIELTATPASEKVSEVTRTELNGKLYNGSFTYTMEIKDEGVASGVDYDNVKIELTTDAADKIIVDQNKITLSNGVYTIPVEVGEGCESNSTYLTVVVPDMVGNTYTYVLPFNVDTWNPRVSVTKSGERIQEVELDGNKTDFYVVDVEYEIVVEDMFLTETGNFVKYIAADDTEHEANVDETGKTYTFVLSNAKGYVNHMTDLQIKFADMAGHFADKIDVSKAPYTDFIYNPDTNTNSLSTNDVAVDAKGPDVTVTLETKDEDGKTVGNAVDYYNGDTTVNINVSDEYLTNAAGSHELTLYYTIDENGTTADKKVVLSARAQGDELVWDVNEDGSYSYSIELTDGMALTKMKIVALDNAMNPGVRGDESSEEMTFDTAKTHKDDDTLVYSGNAIAVDTTPAKIEIEKTSGYYVQTYNDRDYYNEAIGYTITVEDTFLNTAEGVAVAKAIEKLFDGNSVDNNLFFYADGSNGTALSCADKYVFTVNVTNERALNDFDLVVVDNAGNESTIADVNTDADKVYDADADGNSLTSFVDEKNDQGEAVISYNGNPVIVDTVAPEVTLSVEGNVQQYYTNNGVLYVLLKNPSSAASGSYVTPANEETIKFVVTIEDKNLATDSSKYAVRANFEDDSGTWIKNIKVNEDSTITYTKEITVKTDEVGVISVDMNVYDLVGHFDKLTNENYKSINGTVVPSDIDHITVNAGNFRTKVSVDRRRPSSTNDNQAPTIVINNEASAYKTASGLNLYKNSFAFDVDVTDGANNEYNAGLNRVEWKIEDKGGFLATTSGSPTPGSDNYNMNVDIPVTLNGYNESNQAVVTIKAVDNVGNVTTFVREFAVDNLAPRVTVSYDNNDVRNEKYFKANRVATIMVEDINLPANGPYATVTTNGSLNGWSYNGKTATAKYSFTADNDYKFQMSTVDLAQNSTSDAQVKYVGVATHEFTVDKTAPVISVSYNPNSPVGEDAKGVLYYDKDLGVTVTIKEHNFRASDVKANMGTGFSLSGWSGGDNHVASTTYTEGNDYSFTIEYTDLAGNPATSYKSDTFCVDLHDPTIEITEGNMTVDELNIVQNDVKLGFTVTDNEENLKGYTVTVTHLNNEFKEVSADSTEYYTANRIVDDTYATIDFVNFEKIKENDGIYTITVTAEDYAGHKVEISKMTISVNRFGSTFTTEDQFTIGFLTPGSQGGVYQQTLDKNLIIKEINANKVWQDSDQKVEGSTITIDVNGKSVVLVKDEDYTVSVQKKGSGTDAWYEYTYEISTSNFVDDNGLVNGKYSILFYGEDEAGNKNSNESNEFGAIQVGTDGEYTGKIEFSLDTKAPVISAVGIESGESYKESYRQLIITLTDSSPATASVKLNNEDVAFYESKDGLSTDEAWLAYDAATGEYILNVPAKNMVGKQNLVITATDAANNSDDAVIQDFQIYTNPFYAFVNGGGLLVTIIILFILLIVLLLLLMKKKKEEQAPKIEQMK